MHVSLYCLTKFSACNNFLFEIFFLLNFCKRFADGDMWEDIFLSCHHCAGVVLISQTILLVIYF